MYTVHTKTRILGSETRLEEGRQDDPVRNGAHCTAWQAEFNPWDPCEGGRKHQVHKVSSDLYRSIHQPHHTRTHICTYSHIPQIITILESSEVGGGSSTSHLLAAERLLQLWGNSHQMGRPLSRARPSYPHSLSQPHAVAIGAAYRGQQHFSGSTVDSYKNHK